MVLLLSYSFPCCFETLMACLDMYNSEHKGHCPQMSPRISFSNDFVDTQQILKQERSSRSEAPASKDFEFSVTNYSMMSADELFFKGRLLPFRDSGGGNQTQRTIRDELLADDDDDDDNDNGDEASHRPPKSSTRWKGLLGLKRSHIGSRKVDKICEIGTVGDSRKPGFVFEEEHGSKNSQEMLSEGGTSCRDVEIGI